jgi:hypothetical protein
MSRVRYMYLLLNWPSLLKAAFFLAGQYSQKAKIQIKYTKVKFYFICQFQKFLCVVPVRGQIFFNNIFIFSL